MKNTDVLSYTCCNGYLITPLYMVMGAIENLSDQDKADLATTIVNMIHNDELALSVLRYRCKYCGHFLNQEYGNCYCTNEE